MSALGLLVEELDVEHIVARPVDEARDLVARCREHMARIDALLAQSRALRAVHVAN